MLLSLRKKISIALYPDHVALIQTGHGWRPQSGRPILIECVSSTEEPRWQATLTALQEALEQLKIELADVEVVLSDHFTRYALMPWSESVKKDRELAALARIHFETLFGGVVQDWHIVTDCSAYGQSSIGCALDSTLITSLHALFAERKLRMVILQPYLMSVMNRWRQRFAQNTLVAVVESGQCIFVSIKDNGWHSIRTVRATNLLTTDLPALINREILLQGLDAKTSVYLHTLDSVDISQLRQAVDVALLEMSSASAHQAAGLHMLAVRG